MKISIIIFLTVAGVLTFFQQKIFACSCGLPVPSIFVSRQIKQVGNEADAVFAGKVLEVTDNQYSLLVKIKVRAKWKGINDSLVTITTGKGDGDCGYPFKIGKIYLIYGYLTSDRVISTNICQRTALLSKAAKDLAILGRPKAEPKKRKR